MYDAAVSSWVPGFQGFLWSTAVVGSGGACWCWGRHHTLRKATPGDSGHRVRSKLSWYASCWYATSSVEWNSRFLPQQGFLSILISWMLVGVVLRDTGTWRRKRCWQQTGEKQPQHLVLVDSWIVQTALASHFAWVPPVLWTLWKGMWCRRTWQRRLLEAWNTLVYGPLTFRSFCLPLAKADDLPSTQHKESYWCSWRSIVHAF